MKGFAVEFGIGVRGPKCLNDGPTRWSKTFSDRFSRFDTIPAVKTPTQPASHVAVAITLNALAKASSLKTRMMGLPDQTKNLTISSAIWIQSTNVTDGQTDIKDRAYA